jgi:hypothetical protein
VRAYVGPYRALPGSLYRSLVLGCENELRLARDTDARGIPGHRRRACEVEAETRNPEQKLERELDKLTQEQYEKLAQALRERIDLAIAAEETDALLKRLMTRPAPSKQSSS